MDWIFDYECNHCAADVCTQGPVVNGSLPVDLLMEEVIMGGALTPNTVKYVSITSVLRERGLALPRRQTG